jgi:hypothetical protein
MKTFTLEELKYDQRLICTLDIVKLPSGAFTLESSQSRKVVARCETEFVTEEEAVDALDAAMKFNREGLTKELENKATMMTIVKAIPFEGGKIIHRTGKFTKDWFTLYDEHGNEQVSANNMGLLAMAVTGTV